MRVNLRHCLYCATLTFLSISVQAQVVATVGSTNITIQDFQKRYKDVMEQTINPPNKEQFLEDLVRYEIGLQEARKMNLQDNPDVQERMNQELYKALVERALAKQVEQITVTEAEMQNYYKDNPELKTSHILTEFKPEATPEQIAAAKTRAETIYEEVKKSKRPFEELVKIYSDDSLSKRSGGDVGWQNRLTLVPSYYDTALRMKAGEVKGLIQTQFGFHIIKLTGRNEYSEANKRSVRMAVFDQKRKVLFDQYFDRVKKKYKITVNKKLIE